MGSRGFITVRLRTRIVVFVLLAVACLGLSLFVKSPVQALTTVPTKMNFQGKIYRPTGADIAQGSYTVNMRFKIYSATTGGTLLWSEDRLVSASQGVTLRDGLFSVKLGDVTPLPPSVFANQTLFFEVEMPTEATASTSSPAWTDGPMTPRQQIATSAYAFNSETLDGLDSEAFARVGASNTFSGTNTFRPSTNGTTTFSIQDSNGVDLLTADSTNDRIYIGEQTADSNVTFLAVDSYNQAADPSGGFNGSIYYNSSTNKLRCFEAGAWKDCISSGSSTAAAPSDVMTTVPGPWAATVAKASTATIVVSPLYVPGPLTVNFMRLRVTTALGAAGDVGVYDINGTRVLNGGSGSLTTAAGTKAIAPAQTGSARILPAGQYFVTATWNSTTGIIAGANTGAAGSYPYAGLITTGGGSVLPTTASFANYTDNGYIYAFTLADR